MDLDKILVFGDSITQWSFDPQVCGWVSSLAHRYCRKFDIINRGYSGYNTRWCKHLLPAVLDNMKPLSDATKFSTGSLQLVVLFLGANDSVLQEKNELQHVPLLEYVENTESMVELILTKHPLSRLVLVTTPPCEYELWKQGRDEKGKPMDRSVESALAYRNALLKWFNGSKYAANPRFAVLDTWSVFFSESNGEYNVHLAKTALADGVHFSKEGNVLFYDGLYSLIAKKWPELDADTFKTPIVWWDKVDTTKIPESLYAS